MKKRIAAMSLTALLATLAIASVAAAGMFGIYRNSLDTLAQRGELIKLSGQSCTRGGADSALRIAIGKRTDACSFRTPVVGRDLEIAATERLLSGTPLALQHQAYLGLELRAGAGAKYQLLVFPLQRKAQLVKVTPEGPEYLQIAKDAASIMGVNKANALRLRATNIKSGPEKGQVMLLAYVGQSVVAEAIDDGGGELTGRASAVTVGAAKGANGVIASVDDIVARLPNPYES